MIGSTFLKLLPTAHLHLRRDLSLETSKNTYPVGAHPIYINIYIYHIYIYVYICINIPFLVFLFRIATFPQRNAEKSPFISPPSSELVGLWPVGSKS